MATSPKKAIILAALQRPWRGPSNSPLATLPSSRTQACAPLFLVASSMAFIGRTARTLAERSYASASGGRQLPLAASVFRTPKNDALRARMQADIDKGRMDREEGQVSYRPNPSPNPNPSPTPNPNPNPPPSLSPNLNPHQRLAMQQMLERSTRSAPPGGAPILAAPIAGAASDFGGTPGCRTPGPMVWMVAPLGVAKSTICPVDRVNGLSKA